MRKMGRILTLFTGIALSSVFHNHTSLPGAYAQSVRGSLSGSILDPTGASIPGAKIEARDPNTGIARETVSSAEGAYTFSELSIGSYNITASANGFATQVQQGVQIVIGSTTALNLTLRAGSIDSVVHVDASAPSVETQSSDVGGTVEARQIVQLPLALGGVGALRSPEAFEFLLPGTTGPGTANSNNGIYTLKIAGSQNFANDDLLDGASQTRSENGSSFDEESPSVEALAEFRVITGIPAAEYGRSEGGIETFVTKSGTNQFHGTFFDIFRNEALDANTWFNNGDLVANCSGAGNTATCRNLYRRPDDKQNDYGASLGGPVWIPHLYNGKDKLFFFFAWEQLSRRVGGTQISTVPTSLERGGDFTDLYNPAAPPSGGAGASPCNGQPIYAGEIFDPATQTTVNGTPCRTPFAGNVVPQARFSSVAANVLNFIPLPTTPGLYNNYYYSSTIPINNTTYTIRIDANASAKHKFFASYSTRDNLRTCCGTPFLPYPEDSATWQQNFETHFGRFGWDFIINPTLLNHFNFGFNRSNSANFAYPTLGSTDYTQALGVGNSPRSTNFPTITWDSRDQYRGLGNTLNNDWIDNGFRFNDSISMEKGRNSLKFGIDYRIQQFSPLSYPTPALTYGRAQTASDPANSEFDGNSLASLLLGQVSGGSFGAGVDAVQPRWASQYYALFAQDDLKVNDKLTLNLGLRWDVDVPRTAAHNFTSNFSPTALDPEYGVPGALVFGSTYNGNTRWADTYYKDFAPRIGFAYSPFADGKTAFRGGGAILYGPLQYADDGNGMFAGYKIQPNFTSGDGFSPAFTNAAFPAYAQAPNLDPGIFNGQSLNGNYIESKFGKTSQLFEWNFEVEQQIAPDLILTVGYLGNKAQNLRSTLQNINNISIGNFALGNELSANLNGNTAGVAAPFNGFTSLWGANVPVQRALRPFPQYDSIDSGCCLQNVGMSSYNALLVSLTRRYRNGLSLQASYTWEKDLTNADSAVPGAGLAVSQVQNPDNLHESKAVSAEDIPQTFVVAPLYQLPFGHGRAYLNHGLASYTAGGWEVGTVQRYQSGQPVPFCCATPIPGWQNNIFYRRDPSQPLASAAYRSGHLNPFVAAENSYFNRAAFIDPNSVAVRGNGAYTFGDIRRYTGEVRTQGFYNEDFSILKETPIRESVLFVFKAELLNAFNRHAFALPDSNPTDSSFGVPTSTINTPRNVQFTARIRF